MLILHVICLALSLLTVFGKFTTDYSEFDESLVKARDAIKLTSTLLAEENVKEINLFDNIVAMWSNLITTISARDDVDEEVRPSEYHIITSHIKELSSTFNSVRPGYQDNEKIEDYLAQIIVKFTDVESIFWKYPLDAVPLMLSLAPVVAIATKVMPSIKLRTVSCSLARALSKYLYPALIMRFEQVQFFQLRSSYMSIENDTRDFVTKYNFVTDAVSKPFNENVDFETEKSINCAIFQDDKDRAQDCLQKDSDDGFDCVSYRKEKHFYGYIKDLASKENKLYMVEKLPKSNCATGYFQLLENNLESVIASAYKLMYSVLPYPWCLPPKDWFPIGNYNFICLIFFLNKQMIFVCYFQFRVFEM